MQEQIACDLCGRVSTRPFVTLPSQHNFGIVQCQHCGLVYLDPRPSPDEIAQYYTSDYYTSLPPQRPSNTSLSTEIRRLAYKARCQCLSEETPPGERYLLSLSRLVLGWRVRRRVPPRCQGRLLDVGCGNGQWLAWIKDSVPGWEVEGVEINSYAAAQARATGDLIIHVGHLESMGLPALQYDMISFWHSLEHVYSPTTTLQEVYRLLRPGGWVGIEVPDIGSWEARQIGGSWYHLDVPKHLYHFSTSTLTVDAHTDVAQVWLSYHDYSVGSRSRQSDTSGERRCFAEHLYSVLSCISWQYNVGPYESMGDPGVCDETTRLNLVDIDQKV